MPMTDEDKAAFVTANGFPPETAVADMATAEEREAYWRNQSKVQQKKAESYSDYDQRKADSEELARVKAESATEHDKAVEEARKQGENIGAARYLKDAVKGRFQALTGKTDEEVDTAFAHVDPSSFTDDKGEILADKLKSFADVFGKKADESTPSNTPPADPVREAMERARNGAGAGGSSGSIADLKAKAKEALTKK